MNLVWGWGLALPEARGNSWTRGLTQATATTTLNPQLLGHQETPMNLFFEGVVFVFVLKLHFFFFLVFLGPNLQHMEVSRPGVKSELQLPAYAIVTATWIQARSVTYTTMHGNARSLIHWARPGIKLSSSWIPVGFITAKPQRELPKLYFFHWVWLT